MDKIRVVFASDPSYIAHVSVAIKSTLENNLSSRIEIDVITGDSEDLRWKTLKNLISLYPNATLFIHNVDDRAVSSLKLNYHFKPSNYYRLFIEALINEDKILYLDADIIVKSELSSLFNTDIQDYFLAAVENPGFDRHENLKMQKNSRYFNSGVMLINLSLWRKEGVFAKVLDFISDNPDAIEFVDQCGLNSVVDGKWLQLDPKYNQQSAFFESKESSLLCFSKDELNTAINDPSIIHYTGSSKPWNLCNKHPYRKEYWKYRQMTSFKANLYDNFSITSLFRHCAPKIVQTFILKRINWYRNLNIKKPFT